MARALRFQAGVPLQFWADSVLTLVHITNRLPTPLLNHRSPYEVLHNVKSEYDHLRVFGCLVMESNPSRNVVDKMSPRGIPCMLLGYPQLKKGYKLLNLTNNSVFVSRDVDFYESICTYKLVHSSCKSQTYVIENSGTLMLNDGVIDFESECEDV